MANEYRSAKERLCHDPGTRVQNRHHPRAPALMSAVHPRRPLSWSRASASPLAQKTYEGYLGRRGLLKYGAKRWNKLLKEAVEQTAATFNWDTLYIGGGDARNPDAQAPEMKSKSSLTERGFTRRHGTVERWG